MSSANRFEVRIPDPGRSEVVAEWCAAMQKRGKFILAELKTEVEKNELLIVFEFDDDVKAEHARNWARAAIDALGIALELDGHRTSSDVFTACIEEAA